MTEETKYVEVNASDGKRVLRVNLRVPVGGRSWLALGVSDVLTQAETFASVVTELASKNEFWQTTIANGGNIVRWWEFPAFKERFALLPLLERVEVVCVMAGIIDLVAEPFDIEAIRDDVLIPLAEQFLNLLIEVAADADTKELVRDLLDGYESCGTISSENVRVLLRVLGGYFAHKAHVQQY